MRISFPGIISLLLLHLLIFTFSVVTVSAYTYSGYKWGGTSAGYYINNVFAASFVTAMKAADATWDAAGSKFRFSYVGTSSRNPNVLASSYSADTYNDIGYTNYGRTGNMAVTWGFSSGSTISERDTTFNTYYSFTTTGATGMYDVQSTMTHEFGHWLKLSDLSSIITPSWCGWSFESTMCGIIYTSETRKRSLETDDKDGIKSIYGT